MIRQFIVLLFFGLLTPCFSQNIEKIYFEYDTAGNQIVRFNCSGCRNADTGKKEITGFDNTTLLTNPSNKLIYYPNPVEDELFIEWSFEDENYITDIFLYDVNNRLLLSKKELNEVTNTKISLVIYPTGIYFTVLNFKDGKQQLLKIFKK